MMNALNWIALLTRATLGAIFLAYGINKVTSYGGVIERIAGGFANTWVPRFVVYPLAVLIPIAELLIGILLLAGYRYRLMLAATGLLVGMLTFGMAIQGNSDTVSRNLGYLLVVAVGLYTAEHNRYGIGAS